MCVHMYSAFCKETGGYSFLFIGDFLDILHVIRTTMIIGLYICVHDCSIDKH